MKTIDTRIRKLEDRFWLANGKLGSLLVLYQAGWGLALDQDRCIQVLGECGFLSTCPVGLVNLLGIPDGLNGEELERFLREYGAETHGLLSITLGQEAQASARGNGKEAGEESQTRNAGREPGGAMRAELRRIRT